MRRFGFLLSFLVLVSVLGGCDSGGLQEGMGENAGAEAAVPSSFKDEMERNAKNMTIKGARPKPGASKKAG